ncbi:MAG TPA: tRNA (N6-threonylcarbamoyladenosine(37)-N6)-methyltransferase TrmO [Gemmatimonadales bacterium]|nr:tRNA (N6-threonylcarbamoyladenosine(37)-N6)-methyltransferase TrmO [Gemmatimonadales bacterium]
MSLTVTPVGYVRSALTDPALAPKQGPEGAPNAWVEIDGQFAAGMLGLRTGQDVVLVTWLHRARRDLLQVHPRDDTAAPLTGVFATRSADRPNPVGLHRVTILQLVGSRIEVGPLEAVDGTPVLDIKPVLPWEAGTRP